MNRQLNQPVSPAGYFFATQQLQQAQLPAANVPKNPCTGQELSKGQELVKHVQKQKQERRQIFLKD